MLVSKKRRDRCGRSVPDDLVYPMREEKIRDNVGVDWSGMSETVDYKDVGNRTRVGDEPLMDCVG